MGLDMYLKKHTYIGAQYEHRNVNGKIEITEGSENKPVKIDFKRVEEIVEVVAYWRKANHIHDWFVREIQDGEDDCKEYCVSRDKIQELISTCKTVLQQPERGMELLPTKSGFFFGSTDYDEHYYNDLRRTIDQLQPLLTEEGGQFLL